MSRPLPKNDSISVVQFRGVPSLSTEPVDIERGGERFRIPRNYLETAVLEKEYVNVKDAFESAALTIVTTFPEFAGATETSIHCFKLGECRGSKVTIDTLSPQENTIRTRVEEAIAAADKSETPAQNGLVEVHLKSSFLDVYLWRGADISDAILIECMKGSAAPYCYVRVNFHGVPFLYEYDRSLLPYWRTIHDRISQLLNSFYQGAVP